MQQPITEIDTQTVALIQNRHSEEEEEGRKMVIGKKKEIKNRL